MSEIQSKEVECYHCKNKIRVVFVKDIGAYFCGKLKCKIMVLTMRGKDWRPFVPPNLWKEAKIIAKEMKLNE